MACTDGRPAGVKPSEVVIPRNIDLQPRFDESLLRAVTVLEGRAEVISQGKWTGRLCKELPRQTPRQVPIRLIPYYAWANRGVSEMTVWLPLR